MLNNVTLLAMAAGLIALPSGIVQAQDLKIRVVGQGKVEVAPATTPAPREMSAPMPDRGGDSQGLNEVQRMLREQQRMEAMLMADGDLSKEDMDKLIQKARERLDRDMQKLEKREQDNARETDPKDKAEEASDIKKDRYRASVRALERDLLYRIDRLRKPGGDTYEANLDNMIDKIKDTFADLQDKLDDDPPATWSTTLDVARKFYNDYLTQVEKWGKDIGIDSTVPNADQRLKQLSDDLINRAKRIRKVGGEKYEDQLDSTIDKIRDTFADLREKLEKTPTKGWAEILASGEKFAAQFSADLDKWSKQMGGDESQPSPLEKITELSRDLLERLGALRKAGGDRYEDNLDSLEDKVRDTYADLKDKILNKNKDQWPKILEDAAKFHREYSDQLETWRIKISNNGKVDRTETPEPVPTPGKVDYPEKDLILPDGTHADIVGGIRIARATPVLRKQLGLENGLEVKEITDADGALSRAGIDVYDVILEVNGSKLDTRTALRETMDGIKKGQEYTVVIMRAGKQQTLKATK